MGGSVFGLNNSVAWEWSLLISQVSRQDFKISERARSKTSSLVVFSQVMSSSIMAKRRLRLAAQLAFKWLVLCHQ